jgi:hypothetical protein
MWSGTPWCRRSSGPMTFTRRRIIDIIVGYGHVLLPPGLGGTRCVKNIGETLRLKTGFAQNPNLQRGGAALVIFFVVIFILTYAVMPHRVSLEVGKPSPQTITAQREVVDYVTTNRLRDQAAGAVPETFDFDPGVLQRAEAGVTSFFARGPGFARMWRIRRKAPGKGRSFRRAAL